MYKCHNILNIYLMTVIIKCNNEQYMSTTHNVMSNSMLMHVTRWYGVVQSYKKYNTFTAT